MISERRGARPRRSAALDAQDDESLVSKVAYVVRCLRPFAEYTHRSHDGGECGRVTVLRPGGQVRTAFS